MNSLREELSSIQSPPSVLGLPRETEQQGRKPTECSSAGVQSTLPVGGSVWAETSREGWSPTETSNSSSRYLSPIHKEPVLFTQISEGAKNKQSIMARDSQKTPTTHTHKKSPES